MAPLTGSSVHVKMQAFTVLQKDKKSANISRKSKEADEAFCWYNRCMTRTVSEMETKLDFKLHLDRLSCFLLLYYDDNPFTFYQQMGFFL